MKTIINKIANKIIIRKYIVIFLLSYLYSCKTNENFIVFNDESKVYLNSFYLYYTSNIPENKGFMFQKIYTELITHYGERPTEAIFYGIRTGKYINKKQEGLWVTKTIWYINVLRTNGTKDFYIHREENFKNGLHHGEYIIYDDEGGILYATIFKDGTGVEKDFHPNGQLYYEIEKKDGYFTDTLKIYDDLGRLAEEFLYEKDSLVYHRKHHIPRRSRIKLEPPDVE